MVTKFLDINKCGSANMAEKNNEKFDMYGFPVHDFTQEQNSSS